MKAVGDRDRELEVLAVTAERLAQRAVEEGKLDDAAYMLGVAVFLRDCIATRSSRFRGRATQRRK